MWQELINVLLKLIETYDNLFILNENKRKAIVEIDMHNLDKIVNEEQKIVNKIVFIEAERRGILKKMAEKDPLINQLSNSKTLTAFCPQEYKEKFSIANTKLSMSVKKVTDINDANRLLMRGALTAINLNINSISQLKADPNYKGNGNQGFSPHREELGFKV
ncbi:flagellar protein FlgN [Pectinatus frisingensis]|uniref:flagellar protein FlgN n=1 Tax=Pectinatus frisingensis TaxID=865 RepID=UPI0015F60A34|nr:flagellar protein FlgN [Pectinatus frisingensis]